MITEKGEYLNFGWAISSPSELPVNFPSEIMK